MTHKQKQDVCIRELLFGMEFLVTYENELKELHANNEFMKVINAITKNTTEEVEFSSDNSTSQYINFKKSCIGQAFLNERLKYRFSSYDCIVSSVLKKGQSGLSASISTYYALRYLTLISEQNSQSKIKIKNPVQEPMQISDNDYRKKWPAAYRCEDGHYVRSKNEQLVDNWLYHHNICHAYELLVVDRRNGKEYINDFYLPEYKLYIEVWGLDTQEYLKKKEQKAEVYRANNLKLLQMTEREIKSLDDFFRRNLTRLNGSPV